MRRWVDARLVFPDRISEFRRFLNNFVSECAAVSTPSIRCRLTPPRRSVAASRPLADPIPPLRLSSKRRDFALFRRLGWDTERLLSTFFWLNFFFA